MIYGNFLSDSCLGSLCFCYYSPRSLFLIKSLFRRRGFRDLDGSFSKGITSSRKDFFEGEVKPWK